MFFYNSSTFLEDLRGASVAYSSKLPTAAMLVLILEHQRAQEWRGL
jgi:hypothetical protein